MASSIKKKLRKNTTKSLTLHSYVIISSLGGKLLLLTKCVFLHKLLLCGTGINTSLYFVNLFRDFIPGFRWIIRTPLTDQLWHLHMQHKSLWSFLDSQWNIIFYWKSEIHLQSEITCVCCVPCSTLLFFFFRSVKIF